MLSNKFLSGLKAAQMNYCHDESELFQFIPDHEDKQNHVDC